MWPFSFSLLSRLIGIIWDDQWNKSLLKEKDLSDNCIILHFPQFWIWTLHNFVLFAWFFWFVKFSTLLLTTATFMYKYKYEPSWNYDNTDSLTYKVTPRETSAPNKCKTKRKENKCQKERKKGESIILLAETCRLLVGIQ